MDTKRRLQILTGLQAFAYSGRDCPGLFGTNVRTVADRRTVVEATDGHVAIVLTLEPGEVLLTADENPRNAMRYDLKDAIAKIKAGVKLMPLPAGERFVDLTAVMPQAAAEGVHAVHFNPALLGRVFAGLAKISGEKQPSIRFELTSPTSPARVTMSIYGCCTAVVAIMPVRA